MTLRFAAATIAATLAMGAIASAEDFHGFDPATFDGAMLPADNLKAMVADAMKVKPPRNGKKYVLGFANLDRDITFCAKVEEGIEENAEAAGIELVIADNNLDGATALTNAESFINRNVDYVIEFQTDANFGATIMQKMKRCRHQGDGDRHPDAGRHLLRRQQPEVRLHGRRLSRPGGDRQVRRRQGQGRLLHPRRPAAIRRRSRRMRTGGQIAGFLAASRVLPETTSSNIDTKNTLEESFAQTNNVLGRIPAGVPIMATAINDQATTGILRAVKQAGREADLIVVGMGADETRDAGQRAGLRRLGRLFPGALRQLPDADGAAELAGKATCRRPVLQTHVMVDKGNVCKYYPDFPCVEGKGIELSFPQEAFVEASGGAARRAVAWRTSKNLVPTRIA